MTKRGNRRGLRVFRRADAVDLAETTLMARPVMDPVPDREVLAAVGSPAGYLNKVLFGQDGDEGGMSLIRLWYAPHYALPRHSHDVDCLYYVVAGEAHLGNQVVAAGDGFFVPAGAPYAYAAGPDGVEVLEFRSANRFAIHVTENLGRWAQMADTARQHHDEWAAQTEAAG
jgi:quercetin dioxygenase-like cupin family protein